MMGAAREAGLYDHHQTNAGPSRKQADGTLKRNDCRHRKCKTAALISDDMALKDKARRRDLVQMAPQVTKDESVPFYCSIYELSQQQQQQSKMPVNTFERHFAEEMTEIIKP